MYNWGEQKEQPVRFKSLFNGDYMGNRGFESHRPIMVVEIYNGPEKKF